MSFHSILFLNEYEQKEAGQAVSPDCFKDLYLDQIVGEITSVKQDYDLLPFFHYPLHETNAIVYRHEVMKELYNQELYHFLISFEKNMSSMQNSLKQSEKLYYKYQKERLFLDAVNTYCHAVDTLYQNLWNIKMESRGFQAFQEFLNDYYRSSEFQALLLDANQLGKELSSIHYCIQIKGNIVKVRAFGSEIDYSEEVLKIFAKFKQGTVKDYGVKYHEAMEMNHVEANILDLVAKLNPDIFLRLDEFYAKKTFFLDSKIKIFSREIQFYIAYIEYVERFQKKGLSFCFPGISLTNKEIYVREGYDLALANKLLLQNSDVVCNDFYLSGKERTFVVTGPNQGGKTTFARMFGQLHYFACLGCPVPGKEGRLSLFDHIFTHFEREEDIQSLQGKLQDDLVRIHAILQKATPDSILIVNEMFSSTTLQDAIVLGKKVMEKIENLDCLCVYVTFVDELSTFNEKTVSLSSMVDDGNPEIRTFKIVRKQADGLSYALSIAEKYKLTYNRLKERLENHEGLFNVQRP